MRADGHITVGVCAREKKALSKHMVAITSRFNPRKFKVGVAVSGVWFIAESTGRVCDFQIMFWDDKDIGIVTGDHAILCPEKSARF